MGIKHSGQPTSSMPTVSYEREIKVEGVETEAAIACYKY